MTSRHTTQTAPQNPRAFRLPDIPEKHPDDMTSSKQLAKGGNQGRLESHLGISRNHHRIRRTLHLRRARRSHTLP